jgi:hypothetical protein
MSIEAHHGHALIEAARAALDSVHRAALAADAGGLRRGLAVAASNLQEAAKAGMDGEASSAIEGAQTIIATALADLDSGALVEMEQRIEEVRKKLAMV